VTLHDLTLPPPTRDLLRKRIRRISETLAQNRLEDERDPLRLAGNQREGGQPEEGHNGEQASELWTSSLTLVLHLFALLLLGQRDPSLSAQQILQTADLSDLLEQSPLGPVDLQLSQRTERLLLGEMDNLPAIWGAHDWVAQPCVAPEILGQVYEGLTDLTPGIASGPMVRLRWRSHEIVTAEDALSRTDKARPPVADHGRRARVLERIERGRFFLSRGFGRKSTGSYYTPSELARHLTAAVLEPLVTPLREAAEPNPQDLLNLRVVDPAMGAGTFLYHAGEFLASALADLYQRAHRSPDPVPGTGACRALVAAHCLHGADCDGLATQIARWTLQLWIGRSDHDFSSLCRHLRTADSLTDEAFDTVAAQNGTSGFDAVLSNPPWEKFLPLAREFFATYDLGIMLAPTARERRQLEEHLKKDARIAAGWEDYLRKWRAYQEKLNRRFHWQEAALQVAPLRGSGRSGPQRTRSTRGHGDLYRFFVERSYQIAKPGGQVGLVLPNSFYANEGATGIRRLLLDQAELRALVGFSNRRKVFEASPGLRFALAVFRKGGSTGAFRAAFGQSDPACLGDILGTSEARAGATLTYDRGLLETVSPGRLCFVECADAETVEVVRRLYSSGERFGSLIASRGVRFYQEMNMTTDSPQFAKTAGVLTQLDLDPDADVREEGLQTLLGRHGFLILHEKGTFRAYNDRVQSCPRYLCPRAAMEGKPRAARAHVHFRLAARATIHSAEAEKAAFCMLPPGVVVGNSALAESHPDERRLQDALLVLAIANSRAFNFAARTRLSTNLNQFILRDLPAPTVAGWERFLIHGALRLSCRHAGFAPLWRSVLGDHWAEEGRPHHWPAVRGPARRRLSAAVDAIIAAGYGLDTAMYGRLLERLPGSGWWSIEEWRETFDQLIRMGPRGFMENEDPYAAVSLPATDRDDLPQDVLSVCSSS